MSAVIKPFGNGIVYVPVQVPNILPTIYSLSYVSLADNIYLVGAYQEVDSFWYDIHAFITYPQFTAYISPTLINSIYSTNIVYDEKYASIVGNNLVVFEEGKINVKYINANVYNSVISTVYYNQDILIIYSTPNNVIIYSMNKNEFYIINLPTITNAVQYAISSAEFLGGYVFILVTYFSGDINNYIVSFAVYGVKFTYSEAVASFLFGDTILTVTNANSPTAGMYFITPILRGNINYLFVSYIIVNTACPAFCTTAMFYGYNINTATTYNTSLTYSGINLPYTAIVSIFSNSVVFVTPNNFGVYAYFLFSAWIGFINNNLVVFYYNVNTNTAGYVTYPMPHDILYPIFMHSNYVIVCINKPGYTQINGYNVAVIPTSIYEVITSDMLSIQITELVLEKNTLKVSGIVTSMYTGQPVSAYVDLYNAISATDDSLSTGSLLGKAQTNTDGEFTITVTFTNSPPVTDIILTASIDPVVMEAVKPIKLAVQPTYGYP